jgi:hypothetical protein
LSVEKAPLTLVPLAELVTVTESSVPPVALATIGSVGETDAGSDGVICTFAAGWSAGAAPPPPEPPAPVGRAVPLVDDVQPASIASPATSAAASHTLPLFELRT